MVKISSIALVLHWYCIAILEPWYCIGIVLLEKKASIVHSCKELNAKPAFGLNEPCKHFERVSIYVISEAFYFYSTLAVLNIVLLSGLYCPILYFR